MNLSVIGYLDKYVYWSPLYLSNIQYGDTKAFGVELSAPAYANRSSLNVTFIITSLLEGAGVEYRGGILYSAKFTKTVLEYKTVTLNIYEMSPIEAERLVTDVESLYAQVVALNYPTLRADVLKKLLEEAFVSEGFGEVGFLAGKLKLLLENELEAGRMIESVKEQIAQAKAKGLDVSETQAVLKLAVKAFEREDFDGSLKYSGEALNVQSIEVEQAFNLAYFIKDYWWAILLVIAVASPAVYAAYRRFAIVYIAHMLEVFTKEFISVQRLMREVQEKYFVKKEIVSPEYYKSMNQLERRLNKISSEMSRLRAARARIASKTVAFELETKERERIVQMIKKVQTAYFVERTMSRGRYFASVEELEKLLTEADAHIVMAKKRLKK